MSRNSRSLGVMGIFIKARSGSKKTGCTMSPLSTKGSGCGYRASPIEEVTVSVKAQGDFGLSEVGLHYSVNGGPDHAVEMLKQKGAKEADGSTTIYLEDFKLV